jgi:hypothetical protein
VVSVPFGRCSSIMLSLYSPEPALPADPEASEYC